MYLAGEAGLRIGEIRELKWREDIDLTEGYLTVNRQAGNGFIGTPKGRTRRTVSMTRTLVDALLVLPVDEGVRDLKGRVVREGYVLHNQDAGELDKDASGSKRRQHCGTRRLHTRRIACAITPGFPIADGTCSAIPSARMRRGSA